MGVLIASNFGTLATLYFNHRKDNKTKVENERLKKDNELTNNIAGLTNALRENTQALMNFESDLQRMFTALKLVAGKRWEKISRVIQNDHPKARKGFKEV